MMLIYLLFSLLSIKLIKVQTQISRELPDNNHDGFSDSQDLLKAFKNSHNNKFEIFEIMYLADKDNDGLISKKEWESFYNVFVEPFNSVCDKNEDLLLDQGELEGCLKGIGSLEGLAKSWEEVKLEKKVELLFMGLSQNTLTINFSHYLFIRKAGFVFKHCINSTNIFISRQEVDACALVVMLTDHNLNTENYLFHVSSFLNLYQNQLLPQNGTALEELKKDQGYSALGFINLFYKLNLFNRVSIFKTDITQQTIILNELKLAIDNGKINDTVLNIFYINQIFNQSKNIVLDFKTFYILQSMAEIIQVFGTDSNFDQETFSKLVLQNKLINETITDYFLKVDDKYDANEFQKQQEEQSQSKDQQKKEGEEEEDPLFKKEKEFMVPGVYLETGLKLQLKKKNMIRNKNKNRYRLLLKEEGEGGLKLIFNSCDLNQDGKLDLNEIFGMIQNSYIFSMIGENSEDRESRMIKAKDIEDKNGQYESIIEIAPNTLKQIQLMKDFDPDLPINILEWLLFINYHLIFNSQINKQIDHSYIQLESLKTLLIRVGIGISDQNIQFSTKNNNIIYDRAFKLAIRDYSQYLLTNKN